MEPQKQATCESAIQLGDLTINAKGGKYVPLRRNSGPPVWQSAQKIIWYPAAFNDQSAMRVGLCLEPDEASKAQLQEIEQHLVRALTALSLSEPKVFGKFLTETDVKDRFQSCLKTSPRGGSYLKLKMDLGRVRMWGPNQEELAEPGNLAGRECRVWCDRAAPPKPAEPAPAPKRRGRPPGSKNKPKAPKTVPAEEAVPAPAPEPPQPPSAPSPAPPAEPVRMTPAQERALRYMQRQDRYMELLARTTHEL